MSDQPGSRVGRTAGRERHDHAHLSRGVALRPSDARHGRKNGRSRCQTQELTPWKAHESPFLRDHVRSNDRMFSDGPLRLLPCGAIREVAFLRSPIAHGRIRRITKPAHSERRVFRRGLSRTCRALSAGPAGRPGGSIRCLGRSNESRDRRGGEQSPSSRAAHGDSRRRTKPNGPTCWRPRTSQLPSGPQLGQARVVSRRGLRDRCDG